MGQNQIAILINCKDCKEDRLVKINGMLKSSYEKRTPYCRRCKAKRITDKISKGWFKKGHSYNNGRKLSNTTKEKLRNFMKGRHHSISTEFKKGIIPWSKANGDKMPSGVLHHNWRGNNVGYSAIHSWVERQLGIPSKCELCGTTAKRRYHWSNISHKYLRELSDWQRLCVSCHKKYDSEFRRRYS